MKKLLLWMLAPLALVLMFSCGDQQKINDLEKQIEQLKQELDANGNHNKAAGEFSISCGAGSTIDTMVEYCIRSHRFSIHNDGLHAYLDVTRLDDLSKGDYTDSTLRYDLEHVHPVLDSSGIYLQLLVCQNNPLPTKGITGNYQELSNVVKVLYDTSSNRYHIRYRLSGVVLDTFVRPANILRWELATGAGEKPIIGITDLMEDTGGLGCD